MLLIRTCKSVALVFRQLPIKLGNEALNTKSPIPES